MDIGRFAPTTSGRAHPGTLLSGLLAWLDIRSRGGRLVLRFENIDPAAQSPHLTSGLLDDLSWFGLDWDELVAQSDCLKTHHAALDRLANLGLLYECDCTRGKVKASRLPSAAGGWVYPGTCRHRKVRDWRASTSGLRVDLGEFRLDLVDEGGTDLSQSVASAMGDPLVRRPDGGVTYQLAVVADDLASGVTRVVRGRDIAPSTATQAALWDLLGALRPTWRHHPLLLEPHGDKLAKLHQSIAADELRRHYTPDGLRGFLGYVCGLRDTPSAVTQGQLLADFSWQRVGRADRVIAWDGRVLSTPLK